MSEISAALVNSQLTKLNFFVNYRNIIAQRYIKYIKNPKFTFQEQLKNGRSSYHLFIVKLVKPNRKEYLKILKYLINIKFLLIYIIKLYTLIHFLKIWGLKGAVSSF